LLLGSGAAVDCVDFNGRTALTYAIQARNVDVVKALLLLGADANLRLDNGYTPLMWADAWGTCEVISTLIDYGADIKLKAKRDEGVRSAWSLASDRGDAPIATLVAVFRVFDVISVGADIYLELANRALDYLPAERVPLTIDGQTYSPAVFTEREKIGIIQGVMDAYRRIVAVRRVSVVKRACNWNPG
jgi:hypothetical protein